MKHFHDDNHANNRLQRCFAAYKNDKGHYLVSRIEQATLKGLILQNGKQLQMDNPDLIITPERLGYANTKHQCCYISRNTKRMWKAGLCPENLDVDFVFRGGNGYEDFEHTTALKFIIEGVYPDFRKSLLEIKAGRRAVTAFCPTMAVGLGTTTRNPVLYYKNRPIAYIKDNKIVMGDVNSHLMNVIQQYTDMEILV